MALVLPLTGTCQSPRACWASIRHKVDGSDRTVLARTITHNCNPSILPDCAVIPRRFSFLKLLLWLGYESVNFYFFFFFIFRSWFFILFLNMLESWSSSKRQNHSMIANQTWREFKPFSSMRMRKLIETENRPRTYGQRETYPGLAVRPPDSHSVHTPRSCVCLAYRYAYTLQPSVCVDFYSNKIKSTLNSY